ncbi:MAG: tetratricopeptide repeat protein, partial [Muribaculaceae bacterium]|nr:tetratricopeptide repeat protein [Muribaculaceae bacterium]
FYDEDELVELFDYAGDLNDDYLRMEVLLCGARFYPDSENLRLRRAIFYNGFESDAEQKFFQDNSGNGPLWDILQLRYTELAGDKLIKALDDLLGTYAEFDDEEVIQLVNVASQLGQFNWVLDRIDAIRAHTTFPLTLHYEVAVVAEEAGMYDKAVEMLELLTDEDPSNAEQWYMLAQNYDRTGRTEDALNAVEFALALLPRHKQMQAFRASLFFKLDRSLDLAMRELQEIRKEYPDDPEVLELLCNINDKVNGQYDTTRRLGRMASESRPQYAALTLYLLRMPMETDGDEHHAYDLLEAFFSANESEGTNTRENWVSWARFCADTGHRRLAFLVLDCFNEVGEDLFDLPLYLELAVAMHRDDCAMDIISCLQEKRGKAYYRGDVDQSMLYVIEMMRAGNFRDVQWMIENVDADEYGNPFEMNLEQRMKRKLFLVMMAEIHQKLQLPQYRTAEAWKDFDPLA